MDFGGYLQFLLALIFVLALVALCGVALRRLAPGMQARRAPGAPRRLEVLEVLPLDGRRRLVMVRRDDRAHVLLLGISGDRVIETGLDAEPPADAERAGHAVRKPNPGSTAAGTAGAAMGVGFRRLVDRFGGKGTE